MKPDRDLIVNANAAWKKVQYSARQKLDIAIDRYEVACKLSDGPSEDRSCYWSLQAAKLKEELRHLVESINAGTIADDKPPANKYQSAEDND